MRSASSKGGRKPRLAVITGSGMEEVFPVEGERVVETASASVTVYLSSTRGTSFYFLPRHLSDHSLPPHRIDFRANLRALQSLGVDEVIATSAVGSISKKVGVGELGLVDQFIDFSSRHLTAFEFEPMHVDMTNPYDPDLQRRLLAAARSLRMKLVTGLTYVSVDGPRYETAAEIRMFALLGGDVVGMTGAPEAIVSRELGVRYSSVVVATNYGAGMQERVSHDEVVSVMKEARPAVKNLVTRAILTR